VRVLMLGWEFPPYISGGLGTACYGLTKALSHVGADILFVLPRAVGSEHASHVRLLTPDRAQHPASALACALPGVKFRAVPSRIASPYQSASQAQSPALTSGRVAHRDVARAPDVPARRELVDYGGDLLAEVDRYAQICTDLARKESFDVIHAHDWMTYPAGLAIAAHSGKPLVAHLHSTEFDRSGENVQQQVYDIERRGMQGASAVICVSRMTAAVAADRYDVRPEKIAVVYNGIDPCPRAKPSASRAKRREKVVLFLGRLTMQKGPEYFLAVAKRVLTLMNNVKFIVAGSGDRFHSTVYQASEMGIGDKVRFTGFLRGDDVAKAFGTADLYVMPSVTEPFGIAALEAISHGVPIIISKSSGVSEVLEHALKVDFWDIEEMANKIVAVLRHPPLARTLRKHALAEIRQMTWEKAAGECLTVYRQVCESRLPEDQADLGDYAAASPSCMPSEA
jgi:glycogen synthase